jgi:hypothetical protein
MEHLQEKCNFLRNTFPEQLRRITPNTAAVFGKMNAQQMVEHMAYYIRLAYGNPLVTTQCYTKGSLEPMRAFLMSDKAFKPNTPNSLMSNDPISASCPDYPSAVIEVAKAIDEFFDAFAKKPNLMVHNPFFGTLDYEMSIQLLYKHAQHHLNQFATK